MEKAALWKEGGREGRREGGTEEVSMTKLRKVRVREGGREGGREERTSLSTFSIAAASSSSDFLVLIVATRTIRE
jgi:hypothetical protein